MCHRIFPPRHMRQFFSVDLVQPHSSNTPLFYIVSPSLIKSLLLFFCILTVLNFRQTPRKATLSCQTTVAFPPPVTLKTVWICNSTPLAPSLAAPAYVWPLPARSQGETGII